MSTMQEAERSAPAHTNSKSSYGKLRVRLEDADGPLPGDSPPAPAIPVQNAGHAPAKQPHPLAPQRHEQRQPPQHHLAQQQHHHHHHHLAQQDEDTTQPHQPPLSAAPPPPLRARSRSSSGVDTTSLSSSGVKSAKSAPQRGLTGAIPLDVKGLVERLVHVRLQAAQMGNQLLEAQWATPGSHKNGRPTAASAPPAKSPQASLSLPNKSEPLPPIPLRKPAPTSASAALPATIIPPSAAHSTSQHHPLHNLHNTQHNAQQHPPGPSSTGSMHAPQPPASHSHNLHPLHSARRYHHDHQHTSSPARTSLSLARAHAHPPAHPLSAGQLVMPLSSINSSPRPHHHHHQHHHQRSSPVPPSNSSVRPVSSRPNSAHSRAPSRNFSRTHSAANSRSSSRAGSEFGSEGGHEGPDVEELEPPPPPQVIDPGVIKSTSKRLVELVQQRQKETQEAAKAAAAAAAAAEQEDTFPQWEDRASQGLFVHGQSDSEGVLQPILRPRKPKYSTSGLHGKELAEKALSAIDKALRVLHKAQEGTQGLAAANGPQTSAGASAQAEQLEQRASQLRSLQNDINLGPASPFAQVPASRSGKPLLPPLRLSHGAADAPASSMSADRPNKPARPSLLTHSKSQGPSTPKLDSDSLNSISLVEAARLRSQHCDSASSGGIQKSGHLPSSLEMEARMKKGLRTAKKILKEFKRENHNSGHGDQSSVSSLASSEEEEGPEELTEQEQVYGKGIWGIVGNEKAGEKVAIPARALPPTPDGTRYSGAFGRMGHYRKKMAAEQQAILASCPAAFREDLAQQTEEQIRALAMQAQQNLRDSQAGLNDPHAVQNFMKTVKMLQSQRPFYLPPVQSKDRVQRRSLEAKDVQPQNTWHVSKSIFETRKQMSESHDVVDTDKVRQSQFDLDYSRIASKPLFRKLLTRIDETMRQSSCGDVERDLQQVYEQMSAYKHQLRSVFIYYSCEASRFASEDHGSVTLSSWLQFCSDARIMDNNQKGCTRADLATVFVAVKGGTDSKGSDAINNDAMMRFEFYEGVARAAHGKFIEPRLLDELSDAVVMVVEACILPNCPREALVDPNEFRNERMHTPAMADFLNKHWLFLTALFKLFKAKDHTKHFRIEHWGAFLESSRLLGHSGLEKREAKLIFNWSQMTLVDELKKRKRTVALTHMDFVEAFCRLAEHQALPSEPELDSYFLCEQGIDPKRIVMGLRHTVRQSHANSLTQPPSAAAAGIPSGSNERTDSTEPGSTPSVGAAAGADAHKPGSASVASRGSNATGSMARSSSGSPSKRPSQGTKPLFAGKPDASGNAASEGVGDASAYALKVVEYQRLSGATGHRKRRNSGGLLANPTRPLEVKAGLLLTFILGHMKDILGGSDELDTARKMLQEATMISGGIELG